MTKAVAICGSVRMENSDTSKILGPFLKGMREAGAETSLFYAKQLNVSPCTGDFHCWNTGSGECRIKDDMQHVYRELRRADIMVLATPVYIPLPGEMQNVLNRLCPIIDPTLAVRNGRTRARIHRDFRISKVVLVSTSGWWEKGNFGTVVRIVEEFAKDANVEFAGALLRPHAYMLAHDEKKALLVFDCARKAGYHLVRDGELPKELLDSIAKPLVSKKEWMERNNVSS